jgi:hypothetical protein
MKDLESPHQVRWQAPKPFGDMDFESLFIVHYRDELFCDFILAQRVVLELLRRLEMINRRSKDVVESKLARKHVHHNSKR